MRWLGVSFGVYLHFPYCPSKCHYCDFAVKVAKAIPHRRYASAVAREVALRSGAAAGRRSLSLYLGGGTPSLWDPAAMSEALDAIRATVAFEDAPELTLEANPGFSDAERFAAYRALGVNRLSLGVQSFDARTLAALGRRHSGDEVVGAFRAARESGFSNVTLDLIHGAPEQGFATARDDAARAVALEPEHLSCYALTLTGLAEDVGLAKKVRRGRVKVPDDEAQAEMGAAVRHELTRGGYSRYEISNYARPGRESRHNLLYWTGAEYLGLGCGAFGFSLHVPGDPRQGGRRWGNLRSPERYLEALDAGRLPESVSEELSAGDLLRERFVMGLRLSEGVDLEKTCAELGADALPYVDGARRLVGKGLARFEQGRLSLTDLGLDLQSEAAMEFV
jgi:oxygen-independent coproporphyrinogen-3 oxidase